MRSDRSHLVAVLSFAVQKPRGVAGHQGATVYSNPKIEK